MACRSRDWRRPPESVPEASLGRSHPTPRHAALGRGAARHRDRRGARHLSHPALAQRRGDGRVPLHHHLPPRTAGPAAAGGPRSRPDGNGAGLPAAARGRRGHRGDPVHGVHQLPPVPRGPAASQARAHAPVGAGAPHRRVVRKGAVLLRVVVLVEPAAVLGGALPRAAVRLPRPPVSRGHVSRPRAALLRPSVVRGAAAGVDPRAGGDHCGDDRAGRGHRRHPRPAGGPGPRRRRS